MTGHPHRRRVLSRVLMLLGVLLVLLLGDAAWIGYTAANGLRTARDQIRTGADDLVHGNVSQAAAAFDTARHDAEGAAKLRLHPAGFIAKAIPWIGNDARAVQDLAQAASLTAQAGQTLTAAAQRVGWNGHGIPGFSAGTGLSPQVLQQVSPEIGRAHDFLDQAQTVLAGISTQGLYGAIGDAVLTARSELAGRTALLGSASDVAQLIPSLLQKGHRYLLIIQNPSELRGTGGFMGYYGTLVSDGHHLNLTSLRTADAKQVRAVKAPPDYVARYAPFQALTDMRQANFTPDLPTAAGVITQQAKEKGWGSYDGIILVDPVWLQYMLEATGPITAPGWNGQITSTNVLDVVGKQLPRMPSSKSDPIQGSIGHAVWEAIQSRSMSPTAFATALSRGVAERHMQLWSADPTQEALIDALGAGGRANLGKNPIDVVWEGVGASKIAVFTQRSIDVNVSLDAKGTATVTTTLRAKNAAPSGPPSDLLGHGIDAPVGTFVGYLSVYEPVQIDPYPTYKASAPTVTGQQREFGHQVALGFMQVPLGGTMTWSVTYVAPAATTEANGAHEYRLDFIPQPGFAPLPLTVTIHLPDGSSIRNRSAGLTGGGTTLGYSDIPATEQSIWVQYG